jgi:hypothetical protein
MTFLTAASDPKEVSTMIYLIVKLVRRLKSRRTAGTQPTAADHR